MSTSDDDRSRTRIASSRGAPITIVINALHGGGAEYVGRTWATTLAASGWPVRLVVLTRPSAEQLHRVPASVLDLVEVVTGPRLARYRRLRRLLTSTTSRCVISLQMRPNLLAIMISLTIPQQRRARLAISERNIVSVFVGDVTTAHRWRVRLAKRLYGRAERVLAISHPVAAEMIAAFGVRQERCYVVPNPASDKTSDVKRARSDPLDRLQVLVVGRLVPQKQPLLALEVALELRRRGQDPQVVVFGEGPLEGDMRRAAETLGVELTMHGWVEDWPHMCGSSAVLLLTSQKEGFGNVLVEAARQRIPAVAWSGALGVADALVPGVTGHLAVARTPTALADAVQSARCVDFTGADAWLARFSSQNSAQVLLEAVLGER